MPTPTLCGEWRRRSQTAFGTRAACESVLQTTGFLQDGRFLSAREARLWIDASTGRMRAQQDRGSRPTCPARTGKEQDAVPCSGAGRPGSAATEGPAFDPNFGARAAQALQRPPTDNRTEQDRGALFPACPAGGGPAPAWPGASSRSLFGLPSPGPVEDLHPQLRRGAPWLAHITNLPRSDRGKHNSSKVKRCVNKSAIAARLSMGIRCGHGKGAVAERSDQTVPPKAVELSRANSPVATKLVTRN